VYIAISALYRWVLCLQAKHPGLLASFEMACHDVAEKRSRNRKRLSTYIAAACPGTGSDDDEENHGGPSTPLLKQPKIDSAVSGLPLTQERLDNYVMVRNSKLS